MDQTQFWNLLAKKIAGDASGEELQHLENLLKLNPGWAYQAEHIQDLWRNAADNKEESQLAFEKHLQKMKEAGVDLRAEISSIKPVVKHYKIRNIFAYSSAAIVLFLLAGFIWLNSNKKNSLSGSEKKYSEISSPFGSKTKLVLPDSTVVWLNAGSKLTYNEHFGITNRNTILIGEAFFDVKKSTVPFTIRANNIQIKVLGTAFNVKAYPEDKTTETSLIRGRVEVTLDKRPGEPIILKPNEKLIVANEKLEAKTEVQKKDPKVVIDELTRINDTTIVETSWVHNELIFQDETFRDIANKMERWYGVTIEITDGEIAAERLSGTFTTETIQEALTALQYSTKFHYSIKGKQVTITQ
jgi:ferric-dicitrate binding protein FerR (iron transport regulator)